MGVYVRFLPRCFQETPTWEPQKDARNLASFDLILFVEDLNGDIPHLFE